MVKRSALVIIGVSVGVAVGVVVASLVFFAIRWFRKHADLQQQANERSLSTVPIRTDERGTSFDSSASFSDSVTVKVIDHPAKTSQHLWWSHHSKDKITPTSGIPRYPYKDIQKATQNFTTILGQGAFGPVYKAKMPSGDMVAVKVLASDSKQGEKEFQTEVSLLGRLHHRNLVNLVGYCVDKGAHMLIYEFMSNGSLATFLYEGLLKCLVFPDVKYLDVEKRTLNWEERLQIALDISHGLEYLHDGAVPAVIHRDLKSANILLDHFYRAKVADFGLSKEEKFGRTNSGLKGTYGYIDPTYISTNKFTAKSDIYSFGIILFELITAIHPHQNLMEYINLAAMSSDGIDEILDKRLVGTCNLEEVRCLARIANKCLHNTPRRRPSIGEVMQAISKIKLRHMGKKNVLSLTEDEFSSVVSRIESQHVEMGRLTSIAERA